MKLLPVLVAIVFGSVLFLQPGYAEGLGDLVTSLGGLQGQLKKLATTLTLKPKTGIEKPKHAGSLLDQIQAAKGKVPKKKDDKSPKHNDEKTLPLSSGDALQLDLALGLVSKGGKPPIPLFLKTIGKEDALKALGNFDFTALKKFQAFFSKSTYPVFADVIGERLKVVAIQDKAYADLKKALEKIVQDNGGNLVIPDVLDLKNPADALSLFKDWKKPALQNIQGYLVDNKSSKTADEQEKYGALLAAIGVSLKNIDDAEKRAAEVAAKKKADEEAAKQARIDALANIKTKIQAIMDANPFTTPGKKTVSDFKVPDGFDLDVLNQDEKTAILNGIEITKLTDKVKACAVKPSPGLDTLIARLNNK